MKQTSFQLAGLLAEEYQSLHCSFLWPIHKVLRQLLFLPYLTKHDPRGKVQHQTQTYAENRNKTEIFKSCETLVKLYCILIIDSRRIPKFRSCTYKIKLFSIKHTEKDN